MVKGKIRFYRKREGEEFFFLLVREWSGPERRWIDESIREEDKSENGKSSITELSSYNRGESALTSPSYRHLYFIHPLLYQ